MDNGDIRFEVDLSTGMLRVGVRPPMGLESARAWCPLSIMEFQDHAANLTLQVNTFTRQMLAQMRNGKVPVGAAKS